MMNTVHLIAPLIGRIFIAALFIPAGFSKITGFAGTAAYMASKGLPMTEVLLALTIIIELGGGVLLLIGWRARETALIIFLFLIPVTIVFHGFWGIEDATIGRKEQIAFMKNIGIMGGLLFVAAFGPGNFSLDQKLSEETLS